MREITFSLAAPIPLLNKWERMHWGARGTLKKSMAREIWAALLGQLPSVPLEAATVQVWRHSVQAPDIDNLISKAVLDVLQPASKRHPYGLGIIAGDDQAHVHARIYHVQAVRRVEQCTRVVIREVSAAAFSEMTLERAA